MNPAKLNHRITIQKYTSDIDSDGCITQTWQDYYVCWAYVNNLNGSEYYAAMAVNAEQTVVFEVRDCKKIQNVDTKNYRVMFCGVPYNITFADRVQYAGCRVKLKAVIKGDGNGKI